MTQLTNVHPADELAAIREEIKQLQAVESDLRAKLLAMPNDIDREGDQYRAFIQLSTRESVDKTALIAALGIDVVLPFIKSTAVTTLKTARKDDAKEA